MAPLPGSRRTLPSPFPLALPLPLALALALALGPCPARAVRLLQFGDSLLDVGNDNHLASVKGQFVANFPPYGMSLTPPRFTGRFSDGMMFGDYLAEKMGIPWNSAYLDEKADTRTGVNFAVAGAGALNTTTISSVNLPLQLDWFKDYLQTNPIPAQALAKETVALLSAGGNDFFGYILKNPLGFQKGGLALAEDVAASMISTVTSLYRTGLRNFVILNVGPFGCVPAIRAIPFWSAPGCNKVANGIAQVYNKLLAGEAAMLRAGLRGANIVVVDTYRGLLEVSKATKIPMTKGACCGSPGPINGLVQCGKKSGMFVGKPCRDPQRYLFWDFIHPSHMATGRIFDLAWNGTVEVVSPMNLQTMFTQSRIPFKK